MRSEEQSSQTGKDGTAPSITNRKAQITKPFVLLQTIANRQLVIACSPEAQAISIHPDMTLAQARALCANIEYEPWRPDLDEHTIEALARYLIRFTPTVALTTNDIAQDEAPPSNVQSQISDLRSRIFLDLSGCEHLFGGLSAMVRHIAESLHKFRIPATLAVAPTPGAAFALSCIPPKEELRNTTGVRTLIARSSAALVQAPLSGLRLPRPLLESLHHLGMETIGQLLKLPRKALPSRFGNQIILRLDQLTGQVPEPLIPLTIPVNLKERFDFDGSVFDPQILELTFSDLLSKLLLCLEKRGQGVRELEVKLLAEDESGWTKVEQNGTSAQTFHLHVSRPSRNPRSILTLYRCAMEDLPINHSSKIKKKRFSLNYDAGFTSMQVTILRAQALPHQQLESDQPENAAREQAWQHTLDLINTRLGEGAIEQAQLEQAYLPEKAYKLMPAGIADDDACEPLQASTNRPLHLHSPPEEVKVMVAPSHDDDGIPLSFSFNGALHKVTHAAGPERIAGQWWEGHTKTRDYFDVADDSGSRYWLFRVQETGKWYVHGEFE